MLNMSGNNVVGQPWQKDDLMTNVAYVVCSIKRSGIICSAESVGTSPMT